MAKKSILKCINYTLSIPFFVLAFFVKSINTKVFERDLSGCLSAIDNTDGRIPPVLISALIYSEDHRNLYHFGIDPIGIVRATFACVFGNGIQGASTIEQQFVRVVTGRYERTIYRKIHEQALAIAVCSKRTKLQISTTYLTRAHLGFELVGIKGIETLIDKEICDITLQTSLFAVSCLKYPKPQHDSSNWSFVINRRIQYIMRKHSLNEQLTSVSCGLASCLKFRKSGFGK